MNTTAIYFLFFIIYTAQALLVYQFLAKFMGTKTIWWHYPLVAALFLCSGFLSVYMGITGVLNSGILFVLLVLFCNMALKQSLRISLVAALVVVVLLSVLGNVFTSVLQLLYRTIHLQNILMINILSAVCMVAVLGLILWQISHRFSLASHASFPYLFSLWIPLLMVFIFSEIFAWATIGNTTIIDTDGTVQILVRLDISSWWVLLIFLFALGCILVLLFSYQKFCLLYTEKQQSIQLEQELTWQRKAVKQALAREEHTKAFRHDLHHHIAVLSGLLQQGETDKATQYLDRTASESAVNAHTIQSGSIVVDVLLNDKINIAQRTGIQVSCVAELGSVSVDDYDLCVLLANGMDNAIKACEDVAQQNRFIKIELKRKKGFITVSICNSKTTTFQKGQGYGLRNMRSIAEKYNGSLSTHDGSDTFEIRAILAIPLQKQGPS